MDVSPLPLREEVPPREANVAADKLETVRAPYNHTQLKMVIIFFLYRLWVCNLDFWGDRVFFVYFYCCFLLLAFFFQIHTLHQPLHLNYANFLKMYLSKKRNQKIKI